MSRLVLGGGESPLPLEDKLVQLAWAKLLTAISTQDLLDCSYGDRPGRGALGAVHDLTVDLQYGRDGYLVEADSHGFFDHMDHAAMSVYMTQSARRQEAKFYLEAIPPSLRSCRDSTAWYHEGQTTESVCLLTTHSTLHSILSQHGEALEHGAMISVTEGQGRVRCLPLSP